MVLELHLQLPDATHVLIDQSLSLLALRLPNLVLKATGLERDPLCPLETIPLAELIDLGKKTLCLLVELVELPLAEQAAGLPHPDLPGQHFPLRPVEVPLPEQLVRPPGSCPELLTGPAELHAGLLLDL